MSNTDDDKRAQVGVICAIAAYTMWGVAPIYFKQLQLIPAPEILMHRIVWSVVILIGLIAALGQWPKVKTALRSPAVMKVLLCAGVLLAANWLLFIWAINSNHLLDASLGYYINPLINVFFGRLFLGERLRPLQRVSVVLALAGVAILIFSYGYLPWIALVLAGSFSIYGLLRKQVAVDSMPGLFIETLMMLPVALGYWLLFGSVHSDMTSNPVDLNLLLIAAGLVTTAPLLCFTAAARRIMYSTLGFFQYIGPSLMFLLAVFVYGEPLEEDRLITFGFVWAGLILFSLDSVHDYRRQRRLRKQAAMARQG
ncbi:EamA family transporter RarD [Alteromonas halophila]|uniref:Chloramphenicol resistance permease RarD n=1 Tax=Alteromonas halophila TaxID=516698 RepID=A0A918MY28_9ALTE|nr:EamA family transporter RarD [Alteromonas halophila]GGW84316.1 chloramphenicol resistance permease RarD [Alteromonas halophila]